MHRMVWAAKRHNGKRRHVAGALKCRLAASALAARRQHCSASSASNDKNEVLSIKNVRGVMITFDWAKDKSHCPPTGTLFCCGAVCHHRPDTGAVFFLIVRA
jgi:hypothetical protein